jgi:hypothetical protein
MTNDMQATLVEIQSDLKKIIALQEKRNPTVTHPVSEVPLLDPHWDYSEQFEDFG